MNAPFADVETSSDRYARRFEGAVGRWFLEVQGRAVRALMADRPHARVLDVGGGHAQLAPMLRALGHEVTVLGSSEECGHRLRGSGVSFRVGDPLAAPFAPGTFDVVLCFRLLPHVERWRDLVGELCRLATHAVVVDYPTARSVNALSGALFGLKKGVERDTRPFTVFHDAWVADALAAHGFRVAGRRPQFFWPMALHRALRFAPLARALEGGASFLGLTRAFGSPVVLRADRA
ncbi:MAG TPA: class I SAM-dependent methyltransferase [Vicinamibacteria bacterium]